MPTRRQPPLVPLVLALLVVAGILFVFLYRGRQVSRQADRALVTQSTQEQQLRQVDPLLVKWREVRQIPTTLPVPTAFAVGPKGAVFLGGDRALELVGTGQTPLPGAATCLFSGDRLYLGTKDRVLVRGAASGAWAPLTPVLGERAYLTGIAATAKDLWIADSGNRVIWHFDTRGKLLGSFGGRDGKNKARGLIVPSPHLKVVLKPDGKLLVNNSGRLRVDTYSPAGALIESFGKAAVDIDGFCGCCNPIDVALLPDGGIVTAEKGLPRVKIYRADGVLDTVVVGPEGLSRQCEPQLAVTAQGQILVLDARARVVRVFERTK